MSVRHRTSDRPQTPEERKEAIHAAMQKADPNLYALANLVTQRGGKVTACVLRDEDGNWRRIQDLAFGPPDKPV